ncbi:MAG: alanine:cation symporter family protein [Arenicella sp.]|nr:alanine:cation symporter family protein [Arenicella sp.]
MTRRPCLYTDGNRKRYAGFRQPVCCCSLVFLFVYHLTSVLLYCRKQCCLYSTLNQNPRSHYDLENSLDLSRFFGAVIKSQIVWDLGDIGLGIMAWVNIIGILIIFFMGRPAIRALKDYEAQKAAGVTKYTFDPIKLGIKNAHFWENKK